MQLRCCWAVLLLSLAHQLAVGREVQEHVGGGGQKWAEAYKQLQHLADAQAPQVPTAHYHCTTTRLPCYDCLATTVFVYDCRCHCLRVRLSLPLSSCTTVAATVFMLGCLYATASHTAVGAGVGLDCLDCLRRPLEMRDSGWS